MYKKTALAKAINVALFAGVVTGSQSVLAQGLGVEDDADAVQEIIVTGSRIRKDVFTAPDPVEIVEIEKASVAGIATVGQLLQTETVALGSPQVTAATSFEFVQNGGLGVQTLSLRGLGANRTLVLLNGRRAGPAGIKGGVSAFDLNAIPLSAVERVEILKSGASSIYGSDAVAGVVNIITRRDEGATIDGFISMPQDDGGRQSRLSASWGKASERGNFRVTADYMLQEELKRGDRDYFSCRQDYVFDTETGERIDLVDPRTDQRICTNVFSGHVWVYDYASPTNVPGGFPDLAQYDDGDNLGQYIPGYEQDPDNPNWLSAPEGWYPVLYDAASRAVTNSDHPFYQRKSLNPENETITLFADAEYEIADDVTLYGEALLNRRTTDVNSYSSFWGYIYNSNFDFSCGLGDGCGNPLSAGWTGRQWLSPLTVIDTKSSVEVDYYRVLAGIRGEFGESWTWDISANYSRSDGDYTDNVIYRDSLRDQYFLTGSCEGMTLSVQGIPCMDIPWLDLDFLKGNYSPELRNFILGTETGNTKYTQWSIDGVVTTDLMELPAGTLGAAFGFQYRNDEIRDVPGAITLNPETGGTNNWSGASGGITAGDDATKAVFAEVNVPVLKEIPMIENLTISSSARYTDVDSYGSDTTWKIGVNWQIVDSVRVRFNQGTSFRSPALYELYLADRRSTVPIRIEPCRDYENQYNQGNISETLYLNCAADPRELPPDYSGGQIRPTVFTGGGLGVLKAETSDATTIGIIWQPEFADLSVSIDYFDIEIDDEVDQIGAFGIVAGCYQSEFGYGFTNTEPLCNLFDRSNLNFGLNNIRDSYINIAKQKNRGFDYAIRYITEVPWAGQLRVDLRASRQLEDTRGLFQETVENLNGLIGDPVWVGDSDVTLNRGDWSFYWGMKYIGTSSNVEHFGGNIVNYYGGEARGKLNTEAVQYHAISVRRDFEGTGWSARVGVSNLFDETPPQLTYTQTTGEYTLVGNTPMVSQYDFLGRRFFFNLNKSFD